MAKRMQGYAFSIVGFLRVDPSNLNSTRKATDIIEAAMNGDFGPLSESKEVHGIEVKQRFTSRDAPAPVATDPTPPAGTDPAQLDIDEAARKLAADEGVGHDEGGEGGVDPDPAEELPADPETPLVDQDPAPAGGRRRNK
jgi:hypothetical protein